MSLLHFGHLQTQNLIFTLGSLSDKGLVCHRVQFCEPLAHTGENGSAQRLWRFLLPSLHAFWGRHYRLAQKYPIYKFTCRFTGSDHGISQSNFTQADAVVSTNHALQIRKYFWVVLSSSMTSKSAIIGP